MLKLKQRNLIILIGLSLTNKKDYKNMPRLKAFQIDTDDLISNTTILDETSVLNDLNDVDLTGLQTNHVLAYEGAGSPAFFEPRPLGIIHGRVTTSGSPLAINGNSIADTFIITQNTSPAYYEITHNFGNSDYTVVVSSLSTAVTDYSFIPFDQLANSFKIRGIDSSGVVINDDFQFILIRDGSW